MYWQLWSVHRANEKRWLESRLRPESIHIWGVVHSTWGIEIQSERCETEWWWEGNGRNDGKQTSQSSVLEEAHKDALWHCFTHTHTFSAGVVCCCLNCPPLTSANGFHDIATMSLHNEASYGWTGASSVSQLQINRHGSYFYLCIKAETVFTLCQLELYLSLRKSI